MLRNWQISWKLKLVTNKKCNLGYIQTFLITQSKVSQNGGGVRG